MVQGDYTLGIDIGDGTVVAAVCPVGGEDRPAQALAPADRPDVDDPADHPGLPLPSGRPLRRVGSATPMVVAGRPVDPAAAVAALAVQVTELAVPADGTPAAWTVLTVPPSWGGHRRDLLAEALRAAGVDRFSLESGARAVVRHHAGTGAVAEGAAVLVVDLGADTVDTAVLRTTSDDGAQTLAPPPAPLAWGGRDLDDAVVLLVQECLATEDAAGPDGPAAAPAALKAACVAAKEALSTDTVACVELTGPAGPLSLRLVREDLDELVAEPLEAVVAVARRAVAEAELEVADLAAVVLAGGTAAVPLVAETLSAALDRPVVVAAQPALTAALGAAELAADRVVAAAAADDAPAEPVAEEPVAAAAAPAPAGSVRRRPPAAARATTGPAGTTRPPSRSGARPPVPVADPHARRHAARVGVVLSAFLAIVLGVAAAVSSGWSGGPGTEAAADTAAPQQAEVVEDAAGEGTESTDLSPAAAEGSAGPASSRNRDDQAAGTSGRSQSSTAPGPRSSAAGSSSSSSRASTSPSTAGPKPSGSTLPSSAPADPSTSSSQPSTQGTPTPTQPTTVPPTDPPTDPPTETPSDPPPTTEPPADPPPTEPPPTEPPVTETPAASTEPGVSDPPAGSDAPVPGQA